MFPLLLNMRSRLAVIVGGGEVGQRKARAVLAGGGQVRLVCLEAQPNDAGLAGIEWCSEPYQESHLDGGFLAFAAASTAVNQQVVSDAHKRGLLVNVADDPTAVDFFVPSTVRRGPCTIAISTEGTAPTVARELRRLFEEQLDDAFLAWVYALAELRPLILDQVNDQTRRKELLRRLADRSWLDRFRHENAVEVRDAMQSEVLRLVAAAQRPL